LPHRELLHGRAAHRISRQSFTDKEDRDLNYIPLEHL